VDTVILLSGDGDFDLLMQHVKNKQAVVTEIYGVPDLTAKSLSDSVDHFHAIGEGLLI